MLRVNRAEQRADATALASNGRDSGSLVVFGAGPNQLPVLRAAREAGWRVVAVDRNPDASGRPATDRFVCTRLDDERAIRAALADHGDIRGVVARVTDRRAIEIASTIARERDLVAPCPDLVAAATSKRALARHCRRAGLSSPERFAPATVANEGVLPLLIRPDVTIVGKAGIRRVCSLREIPGQIERAASHSANGRVDVAEWIDGCDVSVLARIECGRAFRIAVWDEWVAVAPDGRVEGFGCGMPSIYQGAFDTIDETLARVATAFPASRSMIALSLRIDSEGRAFVIEIHLGIGGDDIAERLIPNAIPELDVFALLVATQTGGVPSLDHATVRPTGLLRAEGGWRSIRDRDVRGIRAACLAEIPAGWEPPRSLVQGDHGR